MNLNELVKETVQAAGYRAVLTYNTLGSSHWQIFKKSGKNPVMRLAYYSRYSRESKRWELVSLPEYEGISQHSILDEVRKARRRAA